jgi:hypothetical protein
MSEAGTDVTAVSIGTVRQYLRDMGPSWVAGAIAAGPATMASLVAAGAPAIQDGPMSRRYCRTVPLETAVTSVPASLIS